MFAKLHFSACIDNPLARFLLPLQPKSKNADMAQLVEHRSRKAGVTGSSPVAGSIAQDSRLRAAFLHLGFRKIWNEDTFGQRMVLSPFKIFES